VLCILILQILSLNCGLGYKLKSIIDVTSNFFKILEKLLISSLGVKPKSQTTLKGKGSASRRAKPKQKI
jgi:hypothetical protein